jgi:hypothetical protein
MIKTLDNNAFEDDRVGRATGKNVAREALEIF